MIVLLESLQFVGIQVHEADYVYWELLLSRVRDQDVDLLCLAWLVDQMRLKDQRY